MCLIVLYSCFKGGGFMYGLRLVISCVFDCVLVADLVVTLLFGWYCGLLWVVITCGMALTL